MAFTRFHDDPCRKIKQLQQSTGVGRYHLSVPGNGDSPAFMSDPHIIAQKWGGNLWTNTIDLESSLLGVDNRSTRDCFRFQNNLSTRVLEKDYFVRNYDCVVDNSVHAPLPSPASLHVASKTGNQVPYSSF